MSYNFLKVVRELAISLGGGSPLPNLRYQGDLGLVDIGLSSRKYQPNLIGLCFNYIAIYFYLSGNMKKFRFMRSGGVFIIL